MHKRVHKIHLLPQRNCCTTNPLFTLILINRISLLLVPQHNNSSKDKYNQFNSKSVHLHNHLFSIIFHNLMRDRRKMELNMEKESILILMVQSMMENIKMIKGMDMEF